MSQIKKKRKKWARKNVWRFNCHKFSKMHWRYGLKNLWKLREKVNTKKPTSKHVILKLLKTKEKEKILKAAKWKTLYVEILLNDKENYSWLLITMDTRNQDTAFFMCWGGKNTCTLESYIQWIYSSKMKVKYIFSETRVEKTF